MAEIIPFRRPKASQRHRGRGLCQAGHHRWQIVKEQVFDVKQGRLVTLERCCRCGTSRTRAL